MKTAEPHHHKEAEAHTQKHHEAHKSHDDSRPKRMALHRLAHKAQVQHAEHHAHKAKAVAKAPVNKALEEAMAAEKAAMHSDAAKKKSPESKAKQRTIEKKMKKLQAQITKDFASVTSFGKKAGYLPPVKMPHM